MRSKKVTPVGQGCKQVTLSAGKNGWQETRCKCHMEYHLKRCMGCGELFHSEASHTKTCGDRCRKRLSRMRHERMFQMVLTYADGSR